MTRAIPATNVSEPAENGVPAITRDFAITKSATRSHQLAPLQKLTTEMLTHLSVPPSFCEPYPPHPLPISLRCGVKAVSALRELEGHLDLEAQLGHVLCLGRRRFLF